MPPPKTNSTLLLLKRFFFSPVFVPNIFTYKVWVLCLCMVAGICTKIYGQEKIYELKNNRKPATIGGYLYIFKDKKLTYKESDIVQATGFTASADEIPVASVIEGNTWVRINISNKTPAHDYNFEIEYPVISDIKLFRQAGDSLIILAHTGNNLLFKERKNGSPNFIFPFTINQGDTAVFYFRINSIHPLVLPVFIRNAEQLDITISNQTLFFGLYFGIILSIILYNLFLFFSTRDRNYLIYIIYLFFLGFAQVTVSGYGFKFLWPQLPVINMYALVIASALAGITGIMFGIYFLRIWYYYRTAVLMPAFIIVLYFIAIAAVISGNYNLAYSILNYAGSSGGITLFIFAFLIWRKGYKTAYYYFIAWAFFLSGIIIFSFRNLGLLPSNNFTVYILYFGSAIEALLLSFALADRINTLRKEKEESQEFALRISRENEKLI
ncbi:MAG: 7TM diverse intracellular signaling domain-containing protein, partial [Dokdonella sp.]|uniref:7TMR-DISM family protein n=1 Tax=Dokdonella sp. TaxID=2291710 RepID=UPI003BAED99A